MKLLEGISANRCSLAFNMSNEERVNLAEEIARELVQRPYVNSVFLTGSTAIGQDRKNSDVDILVVLGYCPGNIKHAVMLDSLKKNLAIDPFSMTQETFTMAQDLQYPLIRNASLLVSK